MPEPDSLLAQLRAQIDDVDRRILALLADRVRLVVQVGDRKRALGIPVHDPQREQCVLERLVQLAGGPLDADMTKRVFERIIGESRRIEQEHLDSR